MWHRGWFSAVIFFGFFKQEMRVSIKKTMKKRRRGLIVAHARRHAAHSAHATHAARRHTAGWFG
jgi:hypothetical protein